jgi:hypothetical protein
MSVILCTGVSDLSPSMATDLALMDVCEAGYDHTIR